eukprot:GHVR01080859.1.p1 GENE.GHVR01080859.1~~GHVR01080859.1.p1  ORF type:complete len:132 (+),score=30.53 GHVR01080859.1:236-631(+)
MNKTEASKVDTNTSVSNPPRVISESVCNASIYPHYTPTNLLHMQMRFMRRAEEQRGQQLVEQQQQAHLDEMMWEVEGKDCDLQEYRKPKSYFNSGDPPPVVPCRRYKHTHRTHNRVYETNLKQSWKVAKTR